MGTKKRILLRSRLGSPEAMAMLTELSKKRGGPAPSVEEVRSMLNRAMGKRTLTGELQKLRQEE